MGQSCSIDVREQCRLSHLADSARTDTVADMTHNFNYGDGPNVSEHTVQRTFWISISAATDLFGCLYSQPSTVINSCSGPCNHWHWTINDWKRVAWSDESGFLLHHVDGRACVRCLPKDIFSPGCTVGYAQVGRGSVLVWAIFFWGEGGHLDQSSQ